MSPFFKVLRDQDDEEQIYRTQELSDGKHIIEHDGVSVPVAIDGKRLAIDLRNSQGDLRRAEVFAFDDMRRFDSNTDIIDMRMEADHSKQDFFLIDGRDNSRLEVVYSEVDPLKEGKPSGQKERE